LINNGFLNTNSAITGGLMGTARTVGGEWREGLWGSVGTGGQRKVGQVLGEFGLLDFTTLWLILTWHAF
jgi:hypothetical protein